MRHRSMPVNADKAPGWANALTETADCGILPVRTVGTAGYGNFGKLIIRRSLLFCKKTNYAKLTE